MPEGGCVVFTLELKVCQRVVVLFLLFYFGVKGLPEGGCVVFTLEIKVCQRVVVLFLLWR